MAHDRAPRGYPDAARTCVRVAGMLRLFAAVGLAAALVAALVPLAAARAGEVGTIVLPFRGGESVRIIQGYNGGSHQGRSYYGLDLVLAEGGTSGAEVLSPVDGRVSWAFAPGTGNGCMAIAFVDGSYSVTLCHVMFHRTYQRGESIARGQSLGSAGPPGTVGNHGTPHVHLELHRGARAYDGVPFSPPDGLLLEGVDLPASGARNEHAFRSSIVSTNRVPNAAEPTASQQPEEPEQQPQQTKPEPPPPPTEEPAPEPENRAEQAQPPEAAEAPQQAEAPASQPEGQPEQPATADGTTGGPVPARLAVVQGTGTCLNVRAEPSLDASILECLPDGTEVALTAEAEHGQEYRWRQIHEAGWAVTDYLRLTRAVVSGTGSCLNVREEPDRGAPRIGCLPDGTLVSIGDGPANGVQDDWYRIEPPEWLERGGWVAGSYLD